MPEGLFGGPTEALPQFALPGLVNERFTTGVQQQGQEKLNEQLAELKAISAEAKKQSTVITQIADAMGFGRPMGIVRAVKEAIETAKSNNKGIVLRP
jgi:hypothetical protein